MARIKVHIPAHTILEAQIRVRITDINYGGHLGNDALLAILHEARLQLLLQFGIQELHEDGGAGLIMADVAIEYKGEGFHGDTLTVRMAFADINKYGFDVTYHVVNQHGKDIARAKTGMLCFNYNTRKLMTLPDEVKARIETKA